MVEFKDYSNEKLKQAGEGITEEFLNRLSQTDRNLWMKDQDISGKRKRKPSQKLFESLENEIQSEKENEKPIQKVSTKVGTVRNKNDAKNTSPSNPKKKKQQTKKAEEATGAELGKSLLSIPGGFASQFSKNQSPISHTSNIQTFSTTFSSYQQPTVTPCSNNHSSPTKSSTVILTDSVTNKVETASMTGAELGKSLLSIPGGFSSQFSSDCQPPFSNTQPNFPLPQSHLEPLTINTRKTNSS